MKKNKKTLKNVKSNNNTATSTPVEKNPTPKPTKQEKEAAKKAHAEELNAKKAEVKAANVKKNNDAQNNNITNVVASTMEENVKIQRRKRESYVHFLRRKRNALKAKHKREVTPIDERKYDLMVFFDRSLEQTIRTAIKGAKLTFGVISNTHAYVKDIDRKTVELIEKELSPWSTKKFKVRFQATRAGMIDKLLTNTKKSHNEKKPTNNTVEVRKAAKERRKKANIDKAVQWWADMTNRSEKGLSRRHRVKPHNVKHKRNVTLQTLKTSKKQVSKAV